jgi:hypothetical protein
MMDTKDKESAPPIAILITTQRENRKITMVEAGMEGGIMGL